MKNLNLIQFASIMFIAFASACTPSYLGKTYAPTEHVDVYLDPADVRKEYIIMGSSSIDKGFRSIDAVQQKAIDLGKEKGADGVILKLMEEVVATSQNASGTVKKKKEKDTFTSSSTTTDIKSEKLLVTFIKYE